MEKDHFHITLPKGYRVKVRIAAARQNISLSRLVELALEQHLKKEKQKHGSKTIRKVD